MPDQITKAQADAFIQALADKGATADQIRAEFEKIRPDITREAPTPIDNGSEAWQAAKNLVAGPYGMAKHLYGMIQPGGADPVAAVGLAGDVAGIMRSHQRELEDAHQEEYLARARGEEGQYPAAVGHAVASGAHAFAAGIPVIGPALMSIPEDFASGHYGRGAVNAAALAAGEVGGPALAGMGAPALTLPRTALRTTGRVMEAAGESPLAHLIAGKKGLAILKLGGRGLQRAVGESPETEALAREMGARPALTGRPARVMTTPSPPLSAEVPVRTPPVTSGVPAPTPVVEPGPMMIPASETQAMLERHAASTSGSAPASSAPVALRLGRSTPSTSTPQSLRIGVATPEAEALSNPAVEATPEEAALEAARQALPGRDVKASTAPTKGRAVIRLSDMAGKSIDDLAPVQSRPLISMEAALAEGDAPLGKVPVETLAKNKGSRSRGEPVPQVSENMRQMISKGTWDPAARVRAIREDIAAAEEQGRRPASHYETFKQKSTEAALKQGITDPAEIAAYVAKGWAEWQRTQAPKTALRVSAPSGKSLSDLVREVGRDDIAMLAREWADADLSPDGGKLTQVLDRRGGSAARTGASTREFLDWLRGSAPDDPAQYTQDAEWTAAKARARAALGGTPAKKK